MVVIKKLSVENFRSHDKYTIELSPTTTAIIGMNGSGKTSLIEALFIGLQGSSFKGLDKEVLKQQSPWWRIEVDFDNCLKRIVTYDSQLVVNRKKITIDNKTSCRMSSKNRYPVVLFEPDNLRLLNGSPARRRRFIDQLICQLDPIYSATLRKYDRALKQRNNLLKKDYSSDDDLFVWNMALSDYGAYIIDKRINFVEHINSQLNEAYNKIAQSKDEVSVHYSHTYIGNIKQKILNDLVKFKNKDKVTGFTSIGPHRHDVIFKLNNSLALEVASRGEIRSIILALKSLEVKIIEEITNQKPIILLDDVFSELDDERQKSLLTADHQVIITSVKLPSNIKQKIKVIKLDKV